MEMQTGVPAGSAAGPAPDYNYLILAENGGNGEWRSSRCTWFQEAGDAGVVHV